MQAVSKPPVRDHVSLHKADELKRAQKVGEFRGATKTFEVKVDSATYDCLVFSAEVNEWTRSSAAPDGTGNLLPESLAGSARNNDKVELARKKVYDLRREYKRTGGDRRKLFAASCLVVAEHGVRRCDESAAFNFLRFGAQLELQDSERKAGRDHEDRLPAGIEVWSCNHPEMPHAFVLVLPSKEVVNRLGKAVYSDSWILGPGTMLLRDVDEVIRPHLDLEKLDLKSGMYHGAQKKKVIERSYRRDRFSDLDLTVKKIDALQPSDRVSPAEVARAYPGAQKERMKALVRDKEIYSGGNRVVPEGARIIYVNKKTGERFKPHRYSLNRHFDYQCKRLLSNWYVGQMAEGRETDSLPYKPGFDFKRALDALCRGDASSIMSVLDPLPPEVASCLVLELIHLGVRDKAEEVFNTFFRHCVDSGMKAGRVGFLCQLTDELRRVPDVFPWAHDVMDQVSRELAGRSGDVPRSWQVLDDPAELMATAIDDDDLGHVRWLAGLNEQWPWMMSNGDLAYALRYAASKRCDTAADFLLSLPATEVDSRDARGVTALCYAISAGATGLAEKLIARGADVNVVMENGCSVLGMAVGSGDAKAISLLLKHGANVNLAPPPARRTALMHAVESGQNEIVQMLLQAGASPEIEDADGNTALLIAVTHGNAHGVELLLMSKETIVDHRDQEGGTPLMLAVDLNRSDIAELLLERGADPYLENRNGDSCVSVVVNAERDEVRSLVMKAALQCGDGHRRNLLIHAAMAGERKLVDELLGLDPMAIDWIDADGCDALFHACKAGHGAVVESLVGVEGARLDRRVGSMSTPLIEAVAGGHSDVIKVLLAHGARPDLANTIGVKPSFIAASNGRADILRVLLDHGAQADAVGPEGYTPLMIAARSGHVDCARLLLDRGAVSGRRNAKRESAWDLATGGAKSLEGLTPSL